MSFRITDNRTLPFFINGIVNVPFCVSAVIGNALILVSFARTPSLLLPSNVLLVGLALSDFLVGLIGQPLYVFCTFHLHTCENKNVLNALVMFSITFLCAISFHTVTLLSIERSLALNLHLRYSEFVTSRRIAFLLGTVWVGNGIVSYLVLDIPVYYHYVATSFGFLCIVVNALLYYQVYRVIRRHQQQITDQLHSQSVENAMNMARFRKTFISMFYVYFVFVMSYTPFLAVAVCTLAISSPNALFPLNILYEITRTVVYVNSSLNPLLFAWRLSDIRAAVKRTIRDAFASIQSSTGLVLN